MPIRFDNKAILEVLLLVAFIIFAVFLIRFTAVKDFFTVERLGSFLQSAGWWAPIVFMAVCALGICLLVPGTVLGAIGSFSPS